MDEQTFDGGAVGTTAVGVVVDDEVVVVAVRADVPVVVLCVTTLRDTGTGTGAGTDTNTETVVMLVQSTRYFNLPVSGPYNSGTSRPRSSQSRRPCTTHPQQHRFLRPGPRDSATKHRPRW